MKRICLILFIFMILQPYLFGRNKGLEYGLEWGAGMRYIAYSDFYYRTDDRMIVKGDGYLYPIHYSGLLLARVNYCLESGLALTSTIGWMGQKENVRVIPILFGAEYPLGGSNTYSKRLFAELGLGIPTAGLMKASKILRSGFAYRFDIGYDTGIEFRLAGSASSLKPKRTSDAGKLINKADLFNNRMYSIGIELSMSIFFQ